MENFAACAHFFLKQFRAVSDTSRGVGSLTRSGDLQHSADAESQQVTCRYDLIG
jgi:hypothetical protein